MKVTLLRTTPDAFDLLVGTKTTRLRGKAPKDMTEDEKKSHFAYMMDTIKSSFEFVDYTFEIEGISKNFTHQLVRTRTGSYQQEASRAIDLSTNGVIVPENLNEMQREIFFDGVADAQARYGEMLAAGVALQDARAILPSNMQTKIMVKFNLRTLHETSKLRLCARAQDEYQNVFRAMREAVVAIHPWTDPLLQVHCVAVGTCAFPRWGSAVVDASGKPIDMAAISHDDFANEAVAYQCPHYDPRMNLSVLKEETRIKFWSAAEIAQSNPVAKDGVSM